MKLNKDVHMICTFREKIIMTKVVVVAAAAATAADTKERTRRVQAMPNGHHPQKPIMQQDRAH